MKITINLIILSLSFAFIVGCTESNANDTGKTKTIKLLDKVSTSWDGTTLEDYPEGTPEVSLLKITVPAGERLASHYHPVINVGYMLKGELTVRDDKGNSKTIKAGESLIELVNTIHYGENTGTEDAEILVFYAGAEELPITTIAD